ncbi:MAG: amidohydrolase [Gemmatimonadetes bacterium]|nr:amidohydrolase [Gemmatimonadota bacterium]
MTRILWAISTAGVIGCLGPEPADLVITNARVYTMTWPDPDGEGQPAPGAPRDATGWHPDAEAVAIRGTTVAFVGSAAQAQTLVGPKTTTVDLNGGTLVPGLIDSHTHVVELSSNLSRVNLVGVTTEAEAVAKIAERAANVSKGEWIIGYGWDEGAWATRYPTMTILTERVPDHPVYLRSLHGFAGWGNRLAFERAGITRSTVPPTGGQILRDAQGEATGVVLNRAVELFDQAVPAAVGAELERQLAVALDTMAGRGYTAIHEAGTYSAGLAAFEALGRAGRLPVRVYAMLSARDTALARRWIARGPRRDDSAMVQVRSVKAYYDGALGSRGARLLEDYSDRPGHRGVSGGSYGFDQGLVSDLMAAGFQVGIHAIGDAGNREVLDFLESVYRRLPRTRDLRHRIEHAQVLHPDDIPRLSRALLIASMEPPHAVEDMAWAEERLGPERVKGAYAWRSLRRAGTRLILNSDLPGSDWDFFYGFHAAVTRRDRALEPAGGWYPAERLTPEEALRGYTVWPTYASFSEGLSGTIAVGRQADLTGLDLDPLAVGEREPDRLVGGRPMLTVTAGRVVFRRPR